MKNELTFKTFLEMVFKKQPDGKMSKVDNYNIDRREQQFIQAAHIIVGGGFANNFKQCVEMDKWFYRGDERYTEHFKEFDSFSLCYVDYGHKQDRLSTFSGSQFSSNLWHELKFPSRRRCIMSSLINKCLIFHQKFGGQAIH